tara:strand:- start:108 stop:371 length:264 start_codon:yes stop_codon:yes gene_type:complete
VVEVLLVLLVVLRKKMELLEVQVVEPEKLDLLEQEIKVDTVLLKGLLVVVQVMVLVVEVVEQLLLEQVLEDGLLLVETVELVLPMIF